MKIIFLVFLFFFALTMLMTFPLVFKMDTHISGTFDTIEIFGTIWSAWQLKYAYFNNLDLNNYYFISYPFGLPVVKAIGLPVGMAVFKWLSVITGEIFMINLLILFSFLLSGLFTFLLTRHLTKSTLGAVFAGIIYAFCPYHFARAWQHLGLAEIQWMPLYFFALFKLMDEQKLKNSALVVLTFFLFSENYTYVYFMAIATIVFVLLTFLKIPPKQKWRFFKFLLLSAFFTFLVTLPSTYLVYKNYFLGPPQEAMNLFHRPFKDLFSQSARPLSYFLPSSFHPFLGGIARMFIESGYYGNNFTEHTLYLGWVPLALAFVAFRSWRQRRISANYSPEEDFCLRFFVLLAMVGWLFSQPPWWRIGAVRIYMPSFFMYKIFPMFRAYARFGIVVMLAISILAGFGLKFILGRFKTQRVKVFIASLFSVTVLLEFLNFPPFKIIDLTKYPAVYDWLRKEPDNVVIAEYPLDVNGHGELYKFYQTKHHKRMINATIPGSYANKISHELKDISNNKTAAGLSWLGVRYVLVHINDYKNNENFMEKQNIENIEKNHGLELVKRFEDVTVYEVVAKPAKPNIQ